VAEVPPGEVTVTSTVPADSAGLTAVIEVSLLNVTEGAAVVPNLTVESGVNPVPVMVTESPPLVDPAVGLTPVTVGAPNVNSSEPPVAEVPPAVVTVTCTLPADSAGVTAMIELSLLNVTEVAAVVPNLTVESEVNPVPVMVTESPPLRWDSPR
jgi:hypothetical protein